MLHHRVKVDLNWPIITDNDPGMVLPNSLYPDGIGKSWCDNVFGETSCKDTSWRVPTGTSAGVFGRDRPRPVLTGVVVTILIIP